MKILIIILAFLFKPVFHTEDIHKLKKFLSKSYSEIPSGTLDHDDKKYSIQSFYIYKTEVTILDYKEFLAHIEQLGDEQILKDVSPNLKIDNESEFWSTYLIHPAYHDYPVLNIKVEAAQYYCEWLEDKLAENFNIDQSSIEVRLPTKSEWIYAAKGGNENNIYGWNSPYLRNSNGEFQANFRSDISQELITYDQSSGSYRIVENETITSHRYTAPAKSYLTNNFQVYNMSGNVAEYVLEDGNPKIMGGSYNSSGYDIRVSSEIAYNSPNIYTGFRPVIEIK